MSDLYTYLGVPRTAGPRELRAAYRRRAKQLHPDINSSPEAEGEFKTLQHAYEVLADPARRALPEQFAKQIVGGGSGGIHRTSRGQARVRQGGVRCGRTTLASNDSPVHRLDRLGEKGPTGRGNFNRDARIWQVFLRHPGVFPRHRGSPRELKWNSIDPIPTRRVPRVDFEFNVTKSAADKARDRNKFVRAQAVWLDDDRVEIPARDPG